MPILGFTPVIAMGTKQQTRKNSLKDLQIILHKDKKSKRSVKQILQMVFFDFFIIHFYAIRIG